MPKPIKKRISKRPEDTETEVTEKLSSIRDTIRQRQKTVIQAALVFIVVLAGVIGFLIYSSYAEKKAKRLEYDGYKTYYRRTPQQTNRDEQYAKALELFKKAYDTKKSPMSLLYIASCYYELGKHDDAIKTLKDFIQRYSAHAEFIPLAYQKMAMAYVKKGDMNEARKTLNVLYNLKGDIYKDFALMEYGKLLEKEGKVDEARKKYQELIEKFPNSPFQDEAKTKVTDKKDR